MKITRYSALLPFLLSACVTSGDVAQDKVYDDPTGVKTVDGPAIVTTGKPLPMNDQTQRELDVTRGRLEELEHRAAQLEAENKRLADENAQLKAPPPAVVAAPVPTGGADVVVVDPKKSGAPLLWELGLRDIEGGQFQEAIASFEELVKTYPKDSRVYYAALGLAMSQYALGNFKEAALNFNQLVDKYPKRNETSIAWYGQGASFLRMNQSEDARLFFEEAAKRFPKTKAGKAAKSASEKRRLQAPPKNLFIAFPDWSERASGAASASSRAR